MEHNKDSLVSIILPCSRVDSFLEQSLNSILSQTYRNFELIIIANGVSEEELFLLEKMSKTDGRIKLLHTLIKGLAFALNLAIHEAKGVFVARMDADDISHKDRIEKQVEFLEANPDYSVVGCKVDLIDENNQILSKKFPFYEHHQEISKIICLRNVMCHPALMFRKESLLAVGAYKFGFMSEDHELFIRMICQNMKFYNLPLHLFSYRRHSAQITNISPAWKHFYEISSFLYMHAFVDRKFKCLLGAVIVFPPVRVLHTFLRRIYSKKGR